MDAWTARDGDPATLEWLQALASAPIGTHALLPDTNLATPEPWPVNLLELLLHGGGEDARRCQKAIPNHVGCSTLALLASHGNRIRAILGRVLRKAKGLFPGTCRHM